MVPPSRELSAAILAGGTARRLGGVRKALLTLDGVPIIERQLAELRTLADPIFIVAPDPGPFGYLGLRVVPDRIPGCGALGGVYTATVESPCDRVLVVACDMPFLDAEFLEYLANHHDGDIVIPRSRRGLEPLCAIYTRRCAEPIRARLERGALEASVLPEAVAVEEIGPESLAAYDPDGLLFANVNTPHDYDRARERVDTLGKTARDRIMDARRFGHS